MALSPRSLEELRDHIGECDRCGLSATRTSIVFGNGNPDARLMIVGEAPGRNEDLQGVPFVGAAGSLLDELLSCAELRRDDVYIANVLKCRPPGNRDPKSDEVGACTPFLMAQIRIVDPEVIVTLGNFATRFLLGTCEPITALRGVPVHVDGRTVLPVFHPAATIYDRTKRATLSADFERVRDLLAGSAGSL